MKRTVILAGTILAATGLSACMTIPCTDCLPGQAQRPQSRDKPIFSETPDTLPNKGIIKPGDSYGKYKGETYSCADPSCSTVSRGKR